MLKFSGASLPLQHPWDRNFAMRRHDSFIRGCLISSLSKPMVCSQFMQSSIGATCMPAFPCSQVKIRPEPRYRSKRLCQPGTVMGSSSSSSNRTDSTYFSMDEEAPPPLHVARYHVAPDPSPWASPASDSLLRGGPASTSGSAEDPVITAPSGAVPVRVRVHIMNIQSIDTVNQNFEAKFYVQLKWWGGRCVWLLVTSMNWSPPSLAFCITFDSHISTLFPLG